VQLPWSLRALDTRGRIHQDHDLDTRCGGLWRHHHQMQA